MKVILNGKKELQGEKADRVMSALSEYDTLTQELQQLDELKKKKLFEQTIMEGRIVEELSDTELNESPCIDLKVYTLTGSLKDSRLIEMVTKEKPKKFGAKGLRNLVTDGTQNGFIKIDVDGVYDWLHDNGYTPPQAREELGKELTSLQVWKLVTKAKETNGTDKIKRNSKIKKNKE